MLSGGPSHEMPDGLDTSPAALPPSLQRRLPGGTIAWAVLQPNAAGRGGLRSYDGFVQRQVLKAQGLCPAERALVAVSATEVGLWYVAPGRFLGRCIGRWSREALVVEGVLPVGTTDPGWPAFRLLLRVEVEPGVVRYRPVAELRATRREPRSDAVAAELLGRRTSG